MAVVLGLVGALSALQQFLARWWPLLALAVAGAAVGLLLLLRARTRNRAAAERQRLLDMHVASTDGRSGRQFEELVARLLRRDGGAT